MANDEKLILHEKEHKELFFFPVASGFLFPFTFTVPEHDSVVKKPTGIFIIIMAASAVVFWAVAFALAPATLSAAAVVAITTGGAVAGGLLAGATSNHLRTKRYNAALKQKAEREELAQSKGLSPAQTEAIEQEASNAFQEAEKKRRSSAISISPFAISGGR